jgi:hypothetical protein
MDGSGGSLAAQLIPMMKGTVMGQNSDVVNNMFHSYSVVNERFI